MLRIRSETNTLMRSAQDFVTIYSFYDLNIAEKLVASHMTTKHDRYMIFILFEIKIIIIYDVTCGSFRFIFFIVSYLDNLDINIGGYF